MSIKVSNELTIGKIISVRGSIVDVWFDRDLPSIYSVLNTGSDSSIIIEVLSQLDANSVRGIALMPTQGLARGMEVQTKGEQLTVPVGANVMGRMFDVFGNTIDQGEALKDVKWRSIHQLPPPLSNRPTKSEIFLLLSERLDMSQVYQPVLPKYRVCQVWGLKN